MQPVHAPICQTVRSWLADAVAEVLRPTAARTALVASPIFLVIKNFGALAITLSIGVVCGAILWRTWYKRLRDWPEDGLAEAGA